MIGKCLFLLCITFGIDANCLKVPQVQYQVGPSPLAFSSPFVSSPVVTAPVVSAPVVASPLVGANCANFAARNQCNNGFFAGNVISGPCGTTDGPETAPLPIIQAPPVTLPAVTGPVVTISSQPIPAPRVIGQRCICTKTVVKPQIIQRQVTVPKIQRYYKRTVTPIVENVTFKTKPISSQPACGCTVAPVAPVAPAARVAPTGNIYSRIC